MAFHFFSEYLLYQISISNKKSYIIVLYRPPSQTTTEFNNFQHKVDEILSDVKQLGSIHFIVLGDFNAKSKTWWTHDIIANEDVQIQTMSCQAILMYRSGFRKQAGSSSS